MTRSLFLVAAVALGLYIMATALLMLVRLYASGSLVRLSAPYVTSNKGNGPSILVVGDSTGVGTGAARPEDSVAGRLAEALEASSVVNLAVNGAKIKDAVVQLQSLPAESAFDLVLIQAGGNDVLRFTSKVQLQQDTESALREAKLRGKRVVAMSSGNVGLAPLFFWPLSFVYDRQTRAAREIFKAETARQGVSYVDLFKEKKDEPFSADPKRYYAKDFLHPSSEGYRLWFEELQSVLKEN